MQKNAAIIRFYCLRSLHARVRLKLSHLLATHGIKALHVFQIYLHRFQMQFAHTNLFHNSTVLLLLLFLLMLLLLLSTQLLVLATHAPQPQHGVGDQRRRSQAATPSQILNEPTELQPRQPQALFDCLAILARVA